MASDQLNRDNAMADKLFAERAQGRSMLLPQANELMASEGYSPTEKAAQTRTSMEALNTGFDSGTQQLENRAAVTRNSAGVPAAMAEMARQRAMGKSDTAGKLEIGFADEKQRRQEEGRRLLASIYGMDTGAATSASHLPAADLGAHAQGIEPGFMDYLMQTMNSAAGAYGKRG